MKLKSKFIINIGTYEHIETEIEVDTEDYETTKKLMREFHFNFHGLLMPERLKGIDRTKSRDVGKQDTEMDYQQELP